MKGALQMAIGTIIHQRRKPLGLTQEQVAETIGKSRSAITNALRLLNLNETELEALRTGAITAGHARALLSCEDVEYRQKMLIAAADGASVRELERMAADSKKVKKSVSASPKKDNFMSEVELSLKNELHRRVTVTKTGNGRGTLTVEFFSEDELADFARRLSGEE